MRIYRLSYIAAAVVMAFLVGCAGPPVYSIPSEPPPESGPLLDVSLSELRAALESDERLIPYVNADETGLTIRWTIEDSETASTWTDCGTINNARIPTSSANRRFDGPWTEFFLTGEGSRMMIELSLTADGNEQTRVHTRFTLSNALVDGWAFDGDERRAHVVPRPIPGTRPTRYCQGTGELGDSLAAHRVPDRMADALVGLIERTAVAEENVLHLEPGDEHRIALFLSRGCSDADVQLLLHPNGQYEWQYSEPDISSITTTGEWQLARSDDPEGQPRLALKNESGPWLHYFAESSSTLDGIDELDRLTPRDTESDCDLVRVRAGPGVEN